MDIIYKSCRRLVVLLEDVELTDDEVALCPWNDVPDLRCSPLFFPAHGCC